MWIVRQYFSAPFLVSHSGFWCAVVCSEFAKSARPANYLMPADCWIIRVKILQGKTLGFELHVKCEAKFN